MHEIRVELPEKKHVDIILGRDTTFSRALAINMLRSSKVQKPADILNKVITNEKDAPRFRVLAAANLWRLNSPDAKKYLLEAAQNVKDPEVLAGIVKYLGRVGDEQALKTVIELKKQNNEVVARRASFAASLISYRLGIEGNDLPVTQEFLKLPPPPHIELKFSKTAKEESDHFFECLASEPFGIEFSSNTLFQIAYPTGQLMLAFNRGIIEENPVKMLQKQKSLLGIIATKGTEYGRYSAAYLIFTSPDAKKDQVNIQITRVTGKPAWAGTMKMVSPDQMKFSISTVGRIGVTPMEMEGILSSPGKIEITTAKSATRATEKQHPRPFVPG